MGMEGYSLATFQAACASLFCERPSSEEEIEEGEVEEAIKSEGEEPKEEEEEAIRMLDEHIVVEDDVLMNGKHELEEEEEGKGDKDVVDGIIEVKVEGEEEKGTEEKTEENEQQQGKTGLPMLVLRHPASGEPLIPIITTPIPLTMQSSGELIEMEEIDALPVGGWSIN